MALRKINGHLINYHDAIIDAQTELQSIASLFYAICNQNKEKRARLLNKLSKYGQKLAHRTRSNTLLSYTKRRQSQLLKKYILTTRSAPSLIVEDMEDLCGFKKKKTTNRINRGKGAILISPQPRKGGKANRIVQLNTEKERSLAPKEENLKNLGVDAGNTLVIPKKKQSQGTSLTQGDPDSRRTKIQNQNPRTGPGASPRRGKSLKGTREKETNPQADQRMERNPGASLTGLGTELDRNTEAIQEKEIRAGPKQRNPEDENQHKIQIRADENE